MKTRTIVHDENHYDVEALLTDEDGNKIWAVVECHPGDTMKIQRILADYNGKVVEILDLSDDKERAFVTSVENKGIFPMHFLRHHGWCEVPSGYVDRKELTDIRGITDDGTTVYPRMVSELHPVDEAQKIEKEIDAVLAWQKKAELEHEDWLDHSRMMEESRY